MSLFRKRRRKRGRVLATKLGFNPNSSSLGVDVTFLLFGATMLSFFTPVVAAMLRAKRATSPTDQKADAGSTE